MVGSIIIGSIFGTIFIESLFFIINYFRKKSKDSFADIQHRMERHYPFKNWSESDLNSLDKNNLKYMSWYELTCPELPYVKAVKVYRYYEKIKQNELIRKQKQLDKYIKRCLISNILRKF
jgi:hypothetical protein